MIVEPGFYILASLLGLAMAAFTVMSVIQFNAVKGNLVGINEDLAAIKANLAEASGEIVNKIESLEAQNTAETVDPQMLSDVKELAQSLADIVPDGGDAEDEPELELDLGEGKTSKGGGDETDEDKGDKAYKREGDQSK